MVFLEFFDVALYIAYHYDIYIHVCYSFCTHTQTHMCVYVYMCMCVCAKEITKGRTRTNKYAALLTQSIQDKRYIEVYIYLLLFLYCLFRTYKIEMHIYTY